MDIGINCNIQTLNDSFNLFYNQPLVAFDVKKSFVRFKSYFFFVTRVLVKLAKSLKTSFVNIDLITYYLLFDFSGSSVLSLEKSGIALFSLFLMVGS